MRSALFVDDEPLLLEGLARMLRPLRHEWEMTFVSSARDALAALDARRFDVVVSDMRMPDMDGAALLERVRERQPEAARIMLTGQTDREGVLRTINCAHRFLHKPCEPALLRLTLERACRLRELVRDGRAAAVAGSLGTLPSLPDAYIELTREMASADASVRRVAAILAKDLGMTAKVLQLVNSAFFGVPRKAATVHQAVVLLGMELVRAIALADGAFTALASPHSSTEAERLRHHGVEVGALARLIAQHEGAPKTALDDAAQAGFLHDIGRLVLATALPAESAEASRLAARDGVPLHAAEEAVLGCSHAAIGAYLLGLWGLPDEIVEAVAFHHYPANAAAGGFSPALAVYAANALAAAQDDPACADVRAAVAAAGCEHRFDEWLRLVDDAAARSAGTA